MSCRTPRSTHTLCLPSPATAAWRPNKQTNNVTSRIITISLHAMALHFCRLVESRCGSKVRYRNTSIEVLVRCHAMMSEWPSCPRSVDTCNLFRTREHEASDIHHFFQLRELIADTPCHRVAPIKRCCSILPSWASTTTTAACRRRRRRSPAAAGVSRTATRRAMTAAARARGRRTRLQTTRTTCDSGSVSHINIKAIVRTEQPLHRPPCSNISNRARRTFLITGGNNTSSTSRRTTPPPAQRDLRRGLQRWSGSPPAPSRPRGPASARRRCSSRPRPSCAATLWARTPGGRHCTRGRRS